MSKIHAAYLNMNYCFALKLNRLMLMFFSTNKISPKGGDEWENGRKISNSELPDFPKKLEYKWRRENFSRWDCEGNTGNNSRNAVAEVLCQVCSDSCQDALKKC